MSRFRLLLLLLLIASFIGTVAQAAAPATLGYQGRLADSAGNPISATLSITFRLFDVQTGGSALWTEVQPAVDVDGGNLAVQLGSVTPLPASIWGRQLYLGVQVSGDTEMAPRPALTASPYALRAAGTMKRSVVVSAEGTPSENGTALLAAVAAITDASAASPVAVELDAGTFDLGTAELLMPAYTMLIGRSQQSTLVTSARAAVDTAATVRLAAHSGARDLTVRNTATAPNANDSVVGLGVYDPLVFQGTIDDVVLERVTGESVAAPGVNGQRAGISLCVTNSRFVDITGRAEGGQFAMGLRSDCPTSEGVFIDGANLFASAATEGLRGAYLSGGGPWQNIKVFIDTNLTVQTVYGIRVFANTVNAGSVLLNPLVSINGSNIGSTTMTFLIEGVRVEQLADVVIKGLVVSMENLRASELAGVGLRTNSSDPRQVGIQDAQIQINAIQDAPQGPGALVGITTKGAAPILDNVRIKLRCLAGGYNPCIGVRVQPPSGGSVQPGPMQLNQVQIEVAHEDPVDGSAHSEAVQTIVATRVVDSQLRVVRSADAEAANVFGLTNPAATLQVTNSTLVLEDTANPNTGCLLIGPSGATGEWYGNHLQGQRCDGGQVSLTCAGNTRRGFGFLASTCP